MVLTEPEAVSAIVIGAIGEFTEPFAEFDEGVREDGVIIVDDAVVAEPDPAELVATAETLYSVPGVKPVTEIEVPIAVASGDVVPVVPETTGEIVTV